MRTLDQASSLFWLLVSIAVFAESLRLGIGTLHEPGMGFMAFSGSGILGILSLGLFLQASFREGEARRKALFSGEWKRIIFVLIVLAAYSWLMPVAGYLLSTFTMMALLFWVLERRRIGMVLLSSLLSTLATYLVFSKWLNCQFPDGLFGF